MISSDSFVRIGKSHDLCQDYACHYVDDGSVSAYLSDGCSSSASRDGKIWTDCGSRMLALSARCVITRPFNDRRTMQWTIERAIACALSVGLDADALSATLIGLNMNDVTASAFIAGDGFLVARRRDSHEYDVVQIEYDKNAPYYLRYALNDRIAYEWANVYGGLYTVRRWLPCVLNDDCCDVEPIECRQDVRDSWREFDDYVHFNTFWWSSRQYDLFLGISDGLASFVHRESDGRLSRIPPLMVLSRLLGCLKGFGGRFLQRNLSGPNGAFRSFGVSGWENCDDLSIVGVYSS